MIVEDSPASNWWGRTWGKRSPIEGGGRRGEGKNISVASIISTRRDLLSKAKIEERE